MKTSKKITPRIVVSEAEVKQQDIKDFRLLRKCLEPVLSIKNKDMLHRIESLLRTSFPMVPLSSETERGV